MVSNVRLIHLYKFYSTFLLVRELFSSTAPYYCFVLLIQHDALFFLLQRCWKLEQNRIQSLAPSTPQNTTKKLLKCVCV